MPQSDQRSGVTGHRVQLGQGNFGNIVVSPRTFTGFAGVHIGSLASRVGSHQPEIKAGTQIFVGYTGRDNDDIAPAHLKFGSFGTAQLNPRIAAVHTQYFMGRAVIVVIAENTIAP